jgi:hypothetical protein
VKNGDMTTVPNEEMSWEGNTLLRSLKGDKKINLRWLLGVPVLKMYLFSEYCQNVVFCVENSGTVT